MICIYITFFFNYYYYLFISFKVKKHIELSISLQFCYTRWCLSCTQTLPPHWGGRRGWGLSGARRSRGATLWGWGQDSICRAWGCPGKSTHSRWCSGGKSWSWTSCAVGGKGSQTGTECRDRRYHPHRCCQEAQEVLLALDDNKNNKEIC